jgi:uncharacterized membrane protein YcaP (DUF421 family)
MFYPDVPLLHALLVVTVVVLANKGLDVLIARFKPAERAIDGVPEEVMRDGVICKPFLSSTTMGVSELFQELRERGIEHLGQVGGAYVEADGDVTVFRAKEPRPGLAIVPPWEIEKPEEASVGTLACMRCGAVDEHGAACTHCGHDHFTKARHELRFATDE